MWKNLALLLCSVVIGCLAAEGALRAVGFERGNKFLAVADEPRDDGSFVGGPDGIFRASPTFSRWLDPTIRINSDGFRSPEFRRDDGGSATMLIGDSYVWGGHAKPITASFADRLRADGRTVYDMGIPGTGPNQYLLIARKYVPLLKPRHVVLFIALINDLQSKPDPAEPFRPLYHVTNTRWLWAYDEDGRYMDAQQAYDHWIGRVGLKKKVRWLAYSTALGTLVWDGVRDTVAAIRAPAAGQAPLAERASFTIAAVNQIRAIARANGAQFNLVIIPAAGRDCRRRENTVTPDERKRLFGAADVVDVDLDHDALFMPFPDCHLTTEGHARVAAALAPVLALPAHEARATAHMTRVRIRR